MPHLPLRSLATLSVLVGLCCPLSAQSNRVGRSMLSSESLSRYGLEVAWTAQAVLNPTRDKVAQIALDEECVYVQASNGVLTAFDSETGRRRWAITLGRFDEPSFQPVSNENLVMTVVGPNMHGIEKLTGKVLWTIRLPSAPSTGPAADEVQVYVGTLDGSLYAFSLRKIRQLYQEQRLPRWSHETIAWRYQAAKEVTSPPLTTGRLVNFASRDGSLYSVSSVRRELTYQFETDAPIVAPMARVGSTQFLASEDFTFYAINVDNGKVQWEFVTGLPIRKAPYALGESLFVMPDRGGLFCLDVATGDQRWWQPKLTDFVSVAGNTVFSRDLDLNLTLVDAKEGRLIGRIPARNYPRHLANDRTDRIYLATDNGSVLAMRQVGRDFPVYHKYPERLPIMPEFEQEEAASAEPAAPAAEGNPPAEANP